MQANPLASPGGQESMSTGLVKTSKTASKAAKEEKAAQLAIDRAAKRDKANNYRELYLLPRYVIEEDGSKRKLEAGEFDEKSQLYSLCVPIKDMSDFGGLSRELSAPPTHTHKQTSCDTAAKVPRPLAIPASARTGLPHPWCASPLQASASACTSARRSLSA